MVWWSGRRSVERQVAALVPTERLGGRLLVARTERLLVAAFVGRWLRFEMELLARVLLGVPELRSNPSRDRAALTQVSLAVDLGCASVPFKQERLVRGRQRR